MEFAELIKRAKQIRQKYAELEKDKYGKEWTKEHLLQGFTKDVEDLKQIIVSNSSNEELAHELSDCLWSVIILADKYGVDLENSFLKTMDELEERIKKNL